MRAVLTRVRERATTIDQPWQRTHCLIPVRLLAPSHAHMTSAANSYSRIDFPVPDKMRKAVCYGVGEPLVIEEASVPEPGVGEVLIRVDYCGVCRSDLHALRGNAIAKALFPLTPGHEERIVVGVVVRCGAGVLHPKAGYRVGVYWIRSCCGHCYSCVAGRENLCQQLTCTGLLEQGGFAEYYIAKANHVVQIPHELGSAAAVPILCAGLAAYNALKLTGTRPGEIVAVFGMGGLGTMAVQYARAMGRRVCAIDRNKEKLELSLKLGAEQCWNGEEEDVLGMIRREYGGVHAAVVASDCPQSFRLAVDCLRRGGTAVYLGTPPLCECGVDICDIVKRQKTIRGSFVGTRADLAEALDFAARGVVKPIYSVRALDEIAQVFDELARNEVKGRVVIRCHNVQTSHPQTNSADALRH